MTPDELNHLLDAYEDAVKRWAQAGSLTDQRLMQAIRGRVVEAFGQHPGPDPALPATPTPAPAPPTPKTNPGKRLFTRPSDDRTAETAARSSSEGSFKMLPEETGMDPGTTFAVDHTPEIYTGLEHHDDREAGS